VKPAHSHAHIGWLCAGFTRRPCSLAGTAATAAAALLQRPPSAACWPLGFPAAPWVMTHQHLQLNHLTVFTCQAQNHMRPCRICWPLADPLGVLMSVQLSRRCTVCDSVCV
jgi:hypothetical protein